MSENLSEFNKKLKVAMNMPPDDKEPFISMNKLAEYMVADPIRRRDIVKNLKDDKDFISNHYHRVYKEIPRYFKSGYKKSRIDKEIKKIEKNDADTNWKKSDDANSIIALKRLKDTDLPDLEDYDIVRDIKKLKYIYLSGVKVSLKPDIYLKNKHSGKVGALKCHIAKTEKYRLNDESRKYAATLLKIGFLDRGYKSKEIDNNACISLDIFDQSYDVAPGAYKQKQYRLEASCEEISLWWQSM